MASLSKGLLNRKALASRRANSASISNSGVTGVIFTCSVCTGIDSVVSTGGFSTGSDVCSIGTSGSFDTIGFIGISFSVGISFVTGISSTETGLLAGSVSTGTDSIQ